MYLQTNQLRSMSFHNLFITISTSDHMLALILKISFIKCPIKWTFFIEPSLDGSGKNQKSWFFLLGLKYTLRTSFESKKFLLKSCPELSNQILSCTNPTQKRWFFIKWTNRQNFLWNFLWKVRNYDSYHPNGTKRWW